MVYSRMAEHSTVTFAAFMWLSYTLLQFIKYTETVCMVHCTKKLSTSFQPCHGHGIWALTAKVELIYLTSHTHMALFTLCADGPGRLSVTTCLCLLDLKTRTPPLPWVISSKQFALADFEVDCEHYLCVCMLHCQSFVKPWRQGPPVASN